MRKTHSRVLSILVLVAAVPVAVGSVTVAAQADGALPGSLGSVTETVAPTALPTEPTPSQPTPSQPVEVEPSSSGMPLPTPSSVSGVAMFQAADGHRYPAGPGIVKSRDKGELFWGEDFDTACYDGRYFARGLKALTQVGRLIEQSGRRVVVTVPPNKSTVDAAGLDGVRLPHGRCTRQGLASQRRLLETFSGKHYLPVLPALEASEERVYWRTDTHWNPLGAAIYAKRLALRLDKKVGRAYTWKRVPAKRFGDMKFPYGEGPREKSNGAKPKTKVTVRPAPGEPALDLDKATTGDYRWTSSPPRRVVPGRTLLVGDSFSYLGLTQLLPLFADGHFLWTTVVPTDQIIQGIVESDTVVLEVVQRYVARSVLAGADFRSALAAALAANPRTP